MRTLTTLFAAALSGALGVTLANVTAPAPQGAPPKIAFVDIGRALQESTKADALADRLAKQSEALKTALSEREKEILKEMQDVQARLAPGTAEYETAKKDIEQRLWTIEYDRKNGARQLKAEQVRGISRIYKEIVSEAERIGTEKGYAAVLHVDGEDIAVEDGQGNVIGDTDLKFQMALRTVLWRSPEHDLTDAVVGALNGE